MESRHPSLAIVGRLSAVLGLLLVSACAASTEVGTGGNMSVPGAPNDECDTFLDCSEGLVCRTSGAVRRCVYPELTQSQDSECGECPYPSNCLGPICVAPDMTGGSCEFDEQCEAHFACISGYCTRDPRSVACTRDEQCFVGLVCRDDGFCGPFVCSSDDDCIGEQICDDGVCVVPAGVCPVRPPNFYGEWNVESELHVREALPDGVADVLDVVQGPFRFIGGDTTTLDLGLPTWVEEAVSSELRRYVDEDIPDYLRELFGAIADLNDVVSTWKTQEVVTFDHAEDGDPTHYVASERWVAIEFMYRGIRLHANAEDVEGWQFSAEGFNATAQCSDLVIDRHAVQVKVRAVLAWLAHNLTSLVTHGRYNTVGEALVPLGEDICPRLASLAQGAVDIVASYDVYDSINNSCQAKWPTWMAEINDLLDEDEAIGGEVIHLSGSGRIAGPNTVSPGTWNGDLLGLEFPGSFYAYR